jgi:hypothetical protein
MAEAKRIQPEKIIMREFRLVKGQIDSPFDFKVGDIKSFDFKVDFNASFNLEEGLIKADFAIDVKTISNEAVTEAFCNYHFVFLFYLENLKEHAQLLEDGNIDWNPYLANAIASISYSTSRGILIARFQGTVMKDFILPVVDPNALWNKKQQQVTV